MGFEVVSSAYAAPKVKKRAPWATGDGKKIKGKRKAGKRSEADDSFSSKKNRRALSAGNKLSFSFDPDDRKEYLTGFHKRRLERQKKAALEVKEAERKARIESRKKHREEIQAMIQQNRPEGNPAISEIAAQDPEQLREKDSKEEVFSSDQHQVTVTTVAFGFGSDDEEAEEDSTEVRNEPSEHRSLHRQGYGSSVKALKSAARKKALAGVISRAPKLGKPSRASRTKGAQPKKNKKKLMKQARVKRAGELSRSAKVGGGKQLNGRQPRKGSGNRR